MQNYKYVRCSYAFEIPEKRPLQNHLFLIGCGCILVMVVVSILVQWP